MSSFFTKPASERKRKREGPAATSGTTRAPTRRETTSAGRDRDRDDGRRRNAGIRSVRSQRPSGRVSDRDAQANEDDDDDIPSDSDSAAGSVTGSLPDDASDSDHEEETAAERRLRLAERYLENIRQETETHGFDAAEIDRDLIAERLREDVAETKGRVYRFIAGDLDWSGAEARFFSADQESITGVAAALDVAVTVAKDGSVTKWELPPLPTSTGNQDTPTNVTARRRPKFLKSFKSNRRRTGDPTYLGHTSQILCVALSEDAKFLATGGADKRIVVWDTTSSHTALKPIKVFPQHRDSVLSLTFRRGTHTLYSASADRTIKIWSLDDLVYTETLFGHQDYVTDIAGMSAETCVSVGARDRTARVWKVVEESQLVFRGGGGGGGGGSGRTVKRKDSKDLENDEETQNFEEGSMDRVAILDSETFVTGSDSGTISLWSINRKKAVHSIPLAHGLDPRTPLDSTYAEAELSTKTPVGRPKPRWITALSTLPYSDVVVSASWDGSIRIWRLSNDRRKLEAVGALASSFSSPTTSTLNTTEPRPSTAQPAKGIITDLSVHERGPKGNEELIIVAGVSKQHRLGRWAGPKCKNGAVVFTVKRRELVADGGIGGAGDEEDGEEDEERDSPETLK